MHNYRFVVKATTSRGKRVVGLSYEIRRCENKYFIHPSKNATNIEYLKENFDLDDYLCRLIKNGTIRESNR